MKHPKNLDPRVKIYDTGHRGDCPHEDIEQINAVSWFRLNYPQYDYLFFHVANEGDIKVQHGLKLKKMGNKKGVADLILLVSTNLHPFAVFEMKRTGKGYLSDDQRKHLNAVVEQGGFACMCRGAKQFKLAVADYLKDV